MRIAIATGSLFWSGHLADGLRAHGHETILLLAGRGAGPDGVTLRSMPLVHDAERVLSAIGPRARLRIQVWTRRMFDGWAARQVRRLRPDLVIGWSSWVQMTLQLASQRGAAVALERGSTHVECQERLLNDEFRRWGEHGEPVAAGVRARELAEYSIADWITVPSRFARDSFLNRGFDPARIETVPFGVDTATFRPEVRSDRRFRVLFVGLVDFRKGVPYLLQAYDRMRSAETELVLMGSVSRRMRKFLAAAGVPHTIRPLGGPRAVAAEMARSSVLVLPSIEEGLARVILEAMACGLPVVATTNTGATDVVDDGAEGFVVSPRDVDGLAARLSLLRDRLDLAGEMGRAGRRKVERAYTWGHYAERVATSIDRRVGARQVLA